MTSLLPRSTSQFSEAKYWDAFFRQRGSKSFEWYGEYPELCGLLHKYIKPKDKILIAGCGNSKIGEGLYDVGYRHITNIDISKTVIKQMRSANKDQRPEMVFEEMDALNMGFETEAFTVVFDKGTLDALMPNKEKDTVDNVTKYLEEIERILRLGGRYIVISLLQEHIMTFLFDYFAERSWMIRICRCNDAEERTYQETQQKPLPVFMAIFTKFKKMPNMESVCELCIYSEDSPVRVKSTEDLKEGVLAAQRVSLICGGLQRSSTDGEEIVFDIYKPGEDTVPRYSIVIAEKEACGKCTGINYAAFVVPQGRECEWMFGSWEGRQFLLRECKVDRLIIITLNRGHSFMSLDQVREELNPIVKDFAPADYKKQILYLSVGGDLGFRHEIHRGESEISGKYVIEETMLDEDLRFRRLVFLSSRNAVQSEVKVKKIRNRKGKELFFVNTSALSMAYHGYMVIGASTVITENKDSRVLLVGLGGGALCTFLQKGFPSLKIEAVELDPAVLSVATKFFGLVVNKQMTVHIKDGLLFIDEAESSGEKYDVIIFDVDNKDVSTGLSSPPREFVEISVLEKVKKLLSPKGVFIVNVVCRQRSFRNELSEKLKLVFSRTKGLRMDDDLNELFYCWSQGRIEPVAALSSAYTRLLEVVKDSKLEKLPCVSPSRFTGLLVD